MRRARGASDVDIPAVIERSIGAAEHYARIDSRYLLLEISQTSSPRRENSIINRADDGHPFVAVNKILAVAAPPERTPLFSITRDEIFILQLRERHPAALS
jgi:hypothetical protein